MFWSFSGLWVHVCFFDFVWGLIVFEFCWFVGVFLFLFIFGFGFGFVWVCFLLLVVGFVVVVGVLCF